MTLLFKTAAETQEIASKLGTMLQPGDVVGLIGPLGAGKTTFVAGLARGLQIDPSFRIVSPTFVYAQIYPGRFPLYHVDLYRVENEKHLFETGISEMIGGDGVAVVEWFDLYPKLWDGDRLEIRFSFAPDGCRTVDVMAFGQRSEGLARDWSVNP